MALQHSITLENGITCAQAYSRIQTIYHSHTQTVVQVQTWASATARQNELPVVRQQAHHLPWSDSVSLTSAYTALKDLSEFTGAIDV